MNERQKPKASTLEVLLGAAFLGFLFYLTRDYWHH